MKNRIQRYFYTMILHKEREYSQEILVRDNCVLLKEERDLDSVICATNKADAAYSIASNSDISKTIV